MISFKLRKKQENTFVYTDKDYFFRNRDEKSLACFNSSNEEMWEIFQEEEYDDYRNYKNYVMCIHRSYFSLLNSDIGKQELQQLPFYPLGWVENLIVFRDNQIYPPVLRCDKLLEDNNELQNIWERDYALMTIRCSDDNNIYFLNSDKKTDYRSEIISLNMKTGEENWHFHTSKFGEGDLPVEKIYGVYQGILIVNIGKWHIVGINTQTGKIEWNIDLGYLGLVPNATNDILYSLISSRYTGGHFLEINPSTGEMVKYGIEKSKVLLASQRKDFILVGTHIITTDDRDGRIGAFNISTHEFDWIWEEEGTSFYGQMKYFDPYLFVQNKDNTLYVFEKE